jgi:hypothetical protein
MDGDAGTMDELDSTEDEVEAYLLCIAYLSRMSSFHAGVSLTNIARFLTKPSPHNKSTSTVSLDHSLCAMGKMLHDATVGSTIHLSAYMLMGDANGSLHDGPSHLSWVRQNYQVVSSPGQK